MPIRIRNPLTLLVARLPWRVQTKLLLAFLAIAALLIALGAVGLGVLNGVNDRTRQLIKLERKIVAYRQAQLDATSQLYHVSAALFAADAQLLDGALRQLNQFGYDLERVQFVADDEIELLARVRQDYEKFVAVMTRLIELIRAGRTTEAHAAQVAEAQPLADSLERLTNQLVNKAESDMVSGIDESEEAYRTSRLMVAGFAIGAIALALLLGRTISWSLIGPIGEIGARLRHIAAGDFGQRVGVANRDELGELATNVNRTSEQLGRLYGDLNTEKERSEALLLNILPRPIVERLHRGEMVIADRIDAATVLFSDLVDSTALEAAWSPERMIEVLGTLFARFDALAAALSLEKIKTIGDGYMVAGGVPEERPDHAAAVAEMALGMRHAAAATARDLNQPLRLRIGIHSGPLVAGVIGTHKFVYDLWGDTVNTASRMEEYGEPDRIHLSAATKSLLGDNFRFEPRGGLDIRGKGRMETFFLEPRLSRE
jgi:class 3 adenylate cyclase/CHASE3 domain sensor protein